MSKHFFKNANERCLVLDNLLFQTFSWAIKVHTANSSIHCKLDAKLWPPLIFVYVVFDETNSSILNLEMLSFAVIDTV